MIPQQAKVKPSGFAVTRDQTARDCKVLAYAIRNRQVLSGKVMKNLGRRFAASVAYALTIEGDAEESTEEDWEEIENEIQESTEAKQAIAEGLISV